MYPRPHRFLFLALLPLLPFAVARAAEQTPIQIGTGFVVAAPDYLITSLHVVDGQNEILVGPSEGRRFVKAEVVAKDEKNDLALLRAPVKRPPLQIAQWDSVPIGIEVFVLGYPQPRYLGVEMKITHGIVNGQRGNDQANQFQLSAEIQKGSSGGPALAPDGSVLGVVKAKLNALSVAEKTNDLPQNVNYAIKSSALLDFLRRSEIQVVPRRVDLTRTVRPFEVYRQHENSVLMVVARKREIAATAQLPAETPKAIGEQQP